MNKIATTLAIILFLGINAFSQCTSNNIFTSTTGVLSDGSGSSDYSNNANCSWLIQPSGGGIITLTFSAFSLESCCDYVRVYDGSNSSSRLIGTYNGSTIPATITSTGSSLFITFTSDNSISYPGWTASYSACTLTKPSITTSNTQVCNGTITLATTALTGVQYQWFNNGSALQNETKANLSTPNAGNYFVTKTSGACSKNSDTITILDSRPTPIIQATAETVCTNGQTELEVLLGNSSVVQDNFTTLNTTLWSVNNGSLTSDCGVLAGRLHFSGSTIPRALTSKTLNLSKGATITFNLEIGNCEPADGGEEVELQISTNNGTNWTTLRTFDVLTSPSPGLAYTYTLTPNSLYNSALVRWVQLDNSGSGFDTWSLDDVEIKAVGTTTGNYSYAWSSNVVSPASKITNTKPLTANTTYTVTMTDQTTNCSGTSSKTITINNNTLSPTIQAASTTVCSSGQTELEVLVGNGSVLQDNFTTLNTTLWGVNNGSLTPYCGTAAGRLYFSGATSPRELTSKTLNLSSGATITFNLEIGNCEPADSGEEVELQISTNNGTSWTRLILYNVTSSPFPGTNYTYTLAANNAYSTALVRWVQLTNSGSGFDTWSLDDVEIKAVGAGSTSGTYSYLWSSNVVNPTAKITNTKPLTTNSTYTVTVTDATTKCYGTASKSITVNSNTLAPVIQAASTTVCTNGKTELEVLIGNSTVVQDNFTTLNTTLWSVNNGSLTSDCGVPAGRLHFSGSTIPRALTSKTLDLSKGATITFNLEIGYCEPADGGEEVELQISTNNGTSWTTLNTYDVSTSQYPGLNYTYTLTANSSYNSALVRWVQLDNSGSGFDTWSLDNVEVKAAGTGTNYTYAWSSNVVSPTAKITNTKAVTTTTTYTVTATDVTTNCYGSASKTITIANQNFNVIVSSIDPNNNYCQGSSLMLSASSAGTKLDNYNNYAFTWAGSSIVNDTVHNPLVSSINQASTYLVTVRNKNTNCYGSGSLIVNPTPTAITPPVITKYTTYYGSNYNAWNQWYSDGLAINGEIYTTLPFTSLPQDGKEHTLMLQYKGASCSYFSNPTSFLIVGNDDVISNDLSGLSIQVYPNPVENIMTIKTTGQNSNNASLLLYDDKGILVQDYQNELGINTNDISIDVSSLSKGIYILELRNQQNVTTQRFVKL